VVQKCPLIHTTSFYRSRPISLIFGTRRTYRYWVRPSLQHLATSPTYCCCTTLGNTNVVFGKIDRATVYFGVKLWNPFLRTSGLRSFDLSPVDCRIWGMMQDRVHQTPDRDVPELRQRLIDTWRGLHHACLYSPYRSASPPFSWYSFYGG